MSKINLKAILIVGVLVGILMFSAFAVGLSFTDIGGQEVRFVEKPNSIDVQSVNKSDFTDLYNDVRPSTVSIYTDISQDSNGQQGSGFVYSENGYIVTNQHVVGGSEDVWLQLKREDWIRGTVVGEDVYTDLAVIKANRLPEYSKPLPVSKNLPKKGSRVIAIGSPYNLRGSVTSGIISGLNRSMTTTNNFVIPDIVQTDSSLNKGNSGGPLISTSGEVVGVNRAKQGATIGFAISPRIINRVVPSLIANGEHNHPYIGIAGRELNPSLASKYDVEPYSGIVIERIVEDSPAKGILQSNNTSKDILLKADGVRIQDNEDLSSYLMRNKSPGDKLNMTIIRENQRKNLSLKLAKREEIN
jgi:S1-C subfamily serine protease